MFLLHHGMMNNMTPIPSPEEIEAAKTPKGGWTKATLQNWGVSWPPRPGWRIILERKYLDKLKKASYK